MQINRRKLVATAALSALLALSGTFSLLRADSGICGGANIALPFTDVSGNTFFCQIAEAYFSGLTNGSTPSTYSPGNAVTRDQMAAFITRTLDQSLKRGSDRTALQQLYNTVPNYAAGLGTTPVGAAPRGVAADGADLWVANHAGNSVTRVRASDGQALQTYSGVPSAKQALVAMGKVFVIGDTNALYMIDPAATNNFFGSPVATLGGIPQGIAFDGGRIWTVNQNPNTISIVTPAAGPWQVTNTPGGQSPSLIVFDGTNMWFGDQQQGGTLSKLDQNGFALGGTALGAVPDYAVFDGTNFWVLNRSAQTMKVVRASGGAVLATLNGPGLTDPVSAAFDGERILVSNYTSHTVSVWEATSLSYLGVYDTGSGTGPRGVCSDGLNFWITLEGASKLARF